MARRRRKSEVPEFLGLSPFIWIIIAPIVVNVLLRITSVGKTIATDAGGYMSPFAGDQ